MKFFVLAFAPVVMILAWAVGVQHIIANTPSDNVSLGSLLVAVLTLIAVPAIMLVGRGALSLAGNYGIEKRFWTATVIVVGLLVEYNCMLAGALADPRNQDLSSQLTVITTLSLMVGLFIMCAIALVVTE